MAQTRNYRQPRGAACEASIPGMSFSSWFKGAAWLGLCAAGCACAVPAAIVLEPVRQPEALDANWRASLCARLPQPCDERTLRLYRPRGSAAPDDYVLLAERPLAMANLHRADGAWQLQKLSDFSQYRHSHADGHGSQAPTFSLAPALYPLAEGRWAVAVLSSVSEMYSGGGAVFRTADFVPLDAPAQAAQAGVPFYCSRMIRACFTEKEYASSRHCHDENRGSLRIAYGASPRGQGAYPWQFQWHETEWAAHAPRSAARTDVLRFTAATAGRVPFCCGPQ